ncbi:MAG: hypothetical protein ABIH03_08740 [Pseudomonadota bacterium]
MSDKEKPSPFEVWRKWFRENCPHWNDVKDIESELGRNNDEPGATAAPEVMEDE